MAGHAIGLQQSEGSLTNLLELTPHKPTHFVDRNPKRADVPCGKCQLCCKVLIVPLAAEEFENYDWVWVMKDGVRLGRALKRRPNGDCIYLGERGCTIHGHAPHVCQRFDCRELFVKSDRNGRREAIKSGKIPKSLFDKGHEMLDRMAPGGGKNHVSDYG